MPKASKVPSLRRAQLLEIKQLRSDARRLDTIARHLRERADEIARGIRRDQRAEEARLNFYSKKSQVDPGLVLTPNVSADLFSPKS